MHVLYLFLENPGIFGVENVEVRKNLRREFGLLRVAQERVDFLVQIDAKRQGVAFIKFADDSL